MGRSPDEEGYGASVIRGSARARRCFPMASNSCVGGVHHHVHGSLCSLSSRQSVLLKKMLSRWPRLAKAPATPMVKFEDGAVQIDAAVIGEGLGIEPSLVQSRVREGKITSRYERGIDEDVGCHRLTFFTESQRLTLIVDDAGNVLQRSVIDFGSRTLPAGLRRPTSPSKPRRERRRP